MIINGFYAVGEIAKLIIKLLIYVYMIIIVVFPPLSGKHILAKLEKYFMKNAPDSMGPNMTSPL